MGVQVISRDGEPEYAVLPWTEYQRLLAAASAGASVPPGEPHTAAIPGTTRAIDTVLGAVEPESLPGFDRLRELREARDLPAEKLARAVGISPSYLSMIETGEREPDAAIRRSLAWELGVPGWSSSS
jgi:DNA-binding XRE family transcriptional regulator